MKIFTILAIIIGIFAAFGALEDCEETRENCCDRANKDDCCKCYPPFDDVTCNPHSCKDCSKN